MTFDPNKYLKDKEGEEDKKQSKSGFNPDKYLKKKEGVTPSESLGTTGESSGGKITPDTPDYLRDVAEKEEVAGSTPPLESKAQSLTWENEIKPQFQWGPSDFKQGAETTGEGQDIISPDMLPEINPFIPNPMLKGISEYGDVADKSNTFYGNITGKTAKTVSEIGKAYNRGMANGLKANNIQTKDAKNIDFARLAELSKVSQENQPQGVYKDFMETEDLAGFFAETAKSPDKLVELISVLSAESFTQQVTAAPSAKGEAIAAGAVAGSAIPGVGTATGAFAGYTGSISYALEESAFITEKMQETGYDATKKEDVEKFFTNEQLLAETKAEAQDKGIVIGALDAISVGVAGKLGGSTVAKRLAREVPAQMGLGAAGEAGGQVAQEGEVSDVKSIIAEGLGELGGSAPEIYMGMVNNNPDLVSTPSGENTKELAQIKKDQEGVARDIDNAPEWLKPELKKQAQELTKKKNKLVAKQAEFYNKFSEEDKNRVSEINRELSELNDYKSANISDETKNQYTDRQNKLVEEKIKIESKYIEDAEKTGQVREESTQEGQEQEERVGDMPEQREEEQQKEVTDGKEEDTEKQQPMLEGVQTRGDEAQERQEGSELRAEEKDEGQVEYFERDLGDGEKATFKVEDGKRVPIDAKEVPEGATIKSEEEVGETEVAPKQEQKSPAPETYTAASETEVDKKTKNKIGSLRKKANKKARKTAAIPKASKEVRKLTTLPLHRIKSKEIAEKTKDLLERVNKKGNVTQEEVNAVTEEVTTHLEQIEATRKEVNTNEQLNKGLENVEERIDNFETEIKDKSTLQKARTNFTNLQKKLRSLEASNTIVNDESQLEGEEDTEKIKTKQENEKRINKLREKLAQKAKDGQLNVEKLNKELNKESNDVAKSLSPRGVAENEAEQNVLQEFFNAVKDYDPEDVGLSSYMNEILNDIQAGFINSKDIHDATIEINAARMAESKEMEEAIDNINELDKNTGGVSDVKALADPRPRAKASLKGWTDRFRLKEWQMWERYLGVGKDSSFFEEVLNPVLTGFKNYTDAVTEALNAFHGVLAPKFKKDGKMSFNSFVSGLSEMLSYINGNSLELDANAIGMVMSEESHRERHGTSNWDKVINSEEKMSNLEAKKQKLYKKVFDKLPKNEDGSINVKKSYKELFKRRRNKRIHTFLRQKFDKNSELANRQKQGNAFRNQPTEFEYEVYFPAIVLDRDGVTDEAELQGIMSLEGMRPKIASDRGKTVTDPSPKVVEIDPLKVFMDYAIQVNRDFYMTSAVRTAYRTTTELRKKAGDTPANTAFRGVRGALEANVKKAFTPDPKLTKIYKTGLQASYLYLLTSTKRLIAESGSEFLRTIFAGPINRRMGKYAKNELYSTARDFAEKIKGVEIDENGKITTTKEFKSNLKNLLDFTSSPFGVGFARNKTDGDISLSEKGGMIAKAGKYMMGFPNRLTLWSLWLPAFDNRFKELTGENFDFSKLNDADYMEKMNREITKAGAYANKRTAQFKGFSFTMGGRTKNKAVVFWTVDALKNPSLFASNQFLGSFGWRDSEELLQSIRDINLAIAGEISKKKEVFTKHAAASPGEAVRNISSIIIGNLQYPITMTMLTYFAVKDEDEEERAPWENDLVKRVDEDGFMTPDMMYEETMGLALFLLSSRHGYASRIAALTAIGGYTGFLEKEKKAAKSKKEKDKIRDKIAKIDRNTKAYFYQEPIVTGMINDNPTRRTSIFEALGIIPGTQAPVAYSEQTIKALESSMEAHKNGNEDQEDRAYQILMYNAFKFNLLLNGSAVPFGKEADKSIVNEKLYKDLEEGAKARKSDRRSPDADRGGDDSRGGR